MSLKSCAVLKTSENINRENESLGCKPGYKLGVSNMYVKLVCRNRNGKKNSLAIKLEYG